MKPVTRVYGAVVDDGDQPGFTATARLDLGVQSWATGSAKSVLAAMSYFTCGFIVAICLYFAFVAGTPVQCSDGIDCGMPNHTNTSASSVSDRGFDPSTRQPLHAAGVGTALRTTTTTLARVPTTLEPTTTALEPETTLSPPTEQPPPSLPTPAPELPVHPSARVAVVMPTDVEYVASQPNGKYLVSSWECYCALRGYTCIFDPTRIGQPKKGEHPATTRYRVVLKYLPFFDYIMMVSLDTYVVNRSFGIEQFLEDSPDVVLSLRTHPLQRTLSFTWMFPPSRFPLRPDPVQHPPMLHTEVLIVRNSKVGERFCQEMMEVSSSGFQGGEDMIAIQVVALRHVYPPSAAVLRVLDFARNISERRSALLPMPGIFGTLGPFQHQDGVMLTLVYYSASSALVAPQLQRTDWVHPSRGRLRVLGEAALVRDWYQGALMRGGDFIVHTKNFYGRGALGLGDVECRPAPQGGTEDTFLAADGQLHPMSAHPELFTNLGNSMNIAQAFGYPIREVFGKNGTSACGGQAC